MQRIRGFHLEARGGGWQARGTGGVEVRCCAPNVIEWRERGRWTAGAGPLGRFRNVYRWTCSPAGLKLAHLRRDPKRPTPLVELRPAGEEGRLETAVPHRCGEDRYAATLHVQCDRLVLSWRVTGPAKDLRLRAVYRPAAQAREMEDF